MSTTTTEFCTTGVTNELEGCEPVGTVFCPDLSDEFVENCVPSHRLPLTSNPPVEGPAVVETSEPQPDFCFYEGQVFYDFVFLPEGDGGTSGWNLLPCLPTGIAETVSSSSPVVVERQDLPATGPGADAAVVAVFLVVAGAVATIVARWGK